jgi:tRNA-specific 2-thiouridylase
VVAIDAVNRQVIVGENEHLAIQHCLVSEINWLSVIREAHFTAACRIRYRHQEVPSTVTILDDGSARVDFHKPQRGVTPGQAAVFYDGDRVLGGGWIETAGTRDTEHGTGIYNQACHLATEGGGETKS